MSENKKITPIILAGGNGTRLWPISREELPKQFCRINGEKSLFYQTIKRIANSELFDPPVVVCNFNHIDLVRAELDACDITPRAIIAEPFGRDTMAAFALPMRVLERDEDSILLMLPSDHKIRNTRQFINSVLEARKVIEHHDSILTFGVQPSRAETGYGYIRAGNVLEYTTGKSVVNFIEKPYQEEAEALLRDKNVMWNSGMFMARLSTLRDECLKLVPQIMDDVASSLPLNSFSAPIVTPDADEFAKVERISFDYAVMEKTDRAAIAPLLSDWNDMGSWKAVWEVSRHDEAGNSTRGNVYFEGCRNTHVSTDGQVVGVNGLENIAVIAQNDAILVTSLERAQEMKGLINAMKADGVAQVTRHSGEERPWGRYDSINRGKMHQVKNICVNPGGQLSLQYHHHRAEHWVVVEGTAQVTINEDVFPLTVGQQVYIPQGAVHRLENLTESPVHIIEVQIGGYLGEDDIVRVEDVYGRSREPGKVAGKTADKPVKLVS